MHILEIPIDVFALPISELPHLLAGAMYDAASEDENESLHYGLERVQFDGVIQRAVQSGLLQPRAPGACVPVPFAGAGSVVTVNDLVRFLADIQCSVEIRRTKASAQPQAAAPAPVVADSASTETTPDPERRLARLRALGGNATYKRGVWKIIGITDLVESEKSEGRKRSDEKTIRADLKEAAQNELDARRAGFGAGLGQR